MIAWIRELDVWSGGYTWDCDYDVSNGSVSTFRHN